MQGRLRIYFLVEKVKNKLRVGIIGIGHIAETTYLHAIANSKFATFVSACDINKSRFLLLNHT